MKDYVDLVKEAKAKMKKMSTSALKKAYGGYNPDGKRWARDELKRRGAWKPKRKTKNYSIKKRMELNYPKGFPFR